MYGQECEKREKGVKGKAAQRFEDLHVYQRARELTNAIYRLTRQRGFAEDCSLVDQIRRAATSIMFNIAEGFERGSKTEFIQFLFIAKGSSGEVRAQLQVAIDQEFIGGEDYDRLYNRARLVSGMLSNFIAHLQSTEYQGEKVARPQRQAMSAHEQRRERLRAAQEANMPRVQERQNGELHNDSNDQRPDD
jgi:four helix bundle protein